MAGRRLAVAALVAGCCAGAVLAHGGEPLLPAIEPAATAIARLDSLQAIVRAEEARVRPSPGLEGNWTRLARAWFQVGDHARAAKCVERARMIGAHEFDTMLLAGRVARSEGRFAEAIDWLERAARLRPDDWEVREDLGLALYLDGQLARASEHWERARAMPQSGSPDRGGLLAALRSAGGTAYRVSGPGRERLRFLAQRSRGPLVIPVRVNGRGPFPFRIDAGSPEVTLHQGLARELGLATHAGGGPSPQFATAYGVLDSLTLGSTTLHRMPVAVTGDPRLSGEGAPRGLLGFEALRRFRFCIDVRDSTLWLEPLAAAGSDNARPPWVPKGEAVYSVPVVLRGTHLLIAYGHVDSGPERPFLIEPGGTGMALAAPASTIAEAGIRLDSTRTRTGTSSSGPVRFITFPIGRLCVGDACVESVEGAYGTFPPRLELNPSFRVAGIVSGGFLSRYRVAVDMARHEVTLVEP